MSETGMEMAKVIYNAACAALDDIGLSYEKFEEDSVITFGHRGEDMNHRLLLAINEAQETIQLVERLPFEIDKERASDIAMAVCLVNDTLLVGGFTYDLAETLSYELTQIYTASLIGEDALKRMILILARTVEEYDDKFMALNKGYLKVEDFRRN